MSNLILPSLHEDMTFYGWMSATHMLNGYPSAYQLSERLLGNGSAGTRLDFPSHLENFCINTSNAYGDIFSLPVSSTVLPYYLVFRPVNLLDDCIRLMASNSVEHLKFILGLPPTQANQFPHLKFCPDCYDLDVKEVGYGYWHRSHQLPSTHMCSLHGGLLHTYCLRENGRGKTELTLPKFDKNNCIQAPIHSHSLLQSISAMSVKALSGLLPSEFNSKQLQFTYQHGLKQQGLMTPKGQIRVNEFLYQLQKYFYPIQSITPFDKLLNQNKIQHFLKLIRKPRGFHHPLSHILLIQYLFKSWNLFCSTYQWESQFQLDLSPQLQFDNLKLSISDENLNHIAIRYKGGESIRKLALVYGYDIGTLMRKLGKLNLVTIKRRPKKISKEVLNYVLDMLSQGQALKSISQKTNLSKSTIDRICTSNPIIQKVWKQNKKVFLRKEKREAVMHFIANNPLATKSAIRSSMSSTIHWLIKHDNEWLNQHMPTIKPARINRKWKNGQPRVNWLLRDDECLKALQEIENIELESWERKKPQAFLRRLPTLSFRPRLSNLPKSKEWITNVLEQLNNSVY